MADVRIGGAVVDFRARNAEFIAAARKNGQALRSQERRVRGLQRRVRRFNMAARDMARRLTSIRTAAVAAAGLAGIGYLIQRQVALADQTIKSARATGLTAESFQELRFAADLGGISAENFTSAMVAFAKRVGEARVETGTMTTILRRMDEALFGNIQRAESTEEAFNLIIDAAVNLESELDRSALLAAAFGRTVGPQMANFLLQGTEGIAAAREEAQRLGAVVSGTLLRSAEELQDDITRLATLLRSRLLTAILENADEIERFTDVLLTGLPHAIDIVAGSLRVLADHLGTIVTLVASLSGARLGAAIGSLFGPVGTGVGLAIGGLAGFGTGRLAVAAIQDLVAGQQEAVTEIELLQQRLAALDDEIVRTTERTLADGTQNAQEIALLRSMAQERIQLGLEISRLHAAAEQLASAGSTRAGAGARSAAAGLGLPSVRELDALLARAERIRSFIGDLRGTAETRLRQSQQQIDLLGLEATAATRLAARNEILNAVADERVRLTERLGVASREAGTIAATYNEAVATGNEQLAGVLEARKAAAEAAHTAAQADLDLFTAQTTNLRDLIALWAQAADAATAYAAAVATTQAQVDAFNTELTREQAALGVQRDLQQSIADAGRRRIRDIERRTAAIGLEADQLELLTYRQEVLEQLVGRRLQLERSLATAQDNQRLAAEAVSRAQIEGHLTVIAAAQERHAAAAAAVRDAQNLVDAFAGQRDAVLATAQAIEGDLIGALEALADAERLSLVRDSWIAVFGSIGRAVEDTAVAITRAFADSTRAIFDASRDFTEALLQDWENLGEALLDILRRLAEEVFRTLIARPLGQAVGDLLSSLLPTAAAGAEAAGGAASAVALSGSAAQLSGSAVALSGSGAALSGAAATLTGSGATISAAGATLTGSAATLTTSGATLTGAGATLTGSAGALAASAGALAGAAGALGAAAAASAIPLPIPGLQHGGFHSGGLSVVGEAGPELVDFRRPGRVYPTDVLSAAIASGGSGVVIHFAPVIESVDESGVRSALLDILPQFDESVRGAIRTNLGRRSATRRQARS